MIYMPPDLQNMVTGAGRLTAEIRLVKAKKRLTMADFRRLAELRTELFGLCPPARFIWINAQPVADLLKTLHQQQKGIRS